MTKLRVSLSILFLAVLAVTAIAAPGPRGFWPAATELTLEFNGSSVYAYTGATRKIGATVTLSPPSPPAGTTLPVGTSWTVT